MEVMKTKWFYMPEKDISTSLVLPLTLDIKSSHLKLSTMNMFSVDDLTYQAKSFS